MLHGAAPAVCPRTYDYLLSQKIAAERLLILEDDHHRRVVGLELGQACSALTEGK